MTTPEQVDEHECDGDCWSLGCDYHEVCTIGECISAEAVEAEEALI
jgi:hypothetical protein